jgi:hypothetical protein
MTLPSLSRLNANPDAHVAKPTYFFMTNRSFSTETICSVLLGPEGVLPEKTSRSSSSSVHVPWASCRRSVGPIPISTRLPSGFNSNALRPRERGKLKLAGRNTISVSVSSSWEWTQCWDRIFEVIFLSIGGFQCDFKVLRSTPVAPPRWQSYGPLAAS